MTPEAEVTPQYDQEFQKFFGAPPASAAKPPQAYDQEFQKFFGSAPPPVHDHEAAHQEHIQAVGDMLDNVRSVGDEITKRFAPVPIPPMLDNTTPDPRNILQRTADAGLNMAGAALNAPQTAALGLGRAAAGARAAMGLETPAEIVPPTSGNLPPGQEVAAGLHGVVQGGMDALMPFAGGAMTSVKGAMALGGGMALQAGGSAGLKKLGVPDAYADLAGDALGVAGGAVIHGGGGDYAAKFKDFFGKEAPSAPVAKAEAAPAEAPVAEAPAVRSGGKPANRPTSPFGVDEKPAAETAAEPVAKNTVRMYHGGDESSFPIKEPRFFSSQRDYAQGYADKSPNGKVVYVDLPEDHPLIEPEWPDQSIARGFHQNVELPADIASKAQPVEAEPEAKPVDEALVRKRPLVDENGEPILTTKGAPRSRVYGTKIDVEAQPEIAKAIDEGAAARAEAKGQAPEERSAMMREHVARLNDSIAAGEPVHMVYDSSKAENMEAPPDPATRQAEHEARLNDPTLSQEAAKSIVPESYSVSKGNDVLVHGKSLDKQLSNGEKLVQMAAGQKLKTPYTPETAGVEMALDLRKGLDKLPKVKQNFWALANRESPGTVFQRALEKRGIDPIDGMEETKETLRLDRIEKILKPDETPAVDAVRASAISGTLKTPVDAFTPVVKRALAKKAAKAEPGFSASGPDAISKPVLSAKTETALAVSDSQQKAVKTSPTLLESGQIESTKPSVPKSDADLEARLQASIEQAQAAKAAKAVAVTARAAEPVSGESRFTTEPAYGRSINIAVPGEQTRYKARYAVREASDVYASHNPQSFEANPDYEHANERDYSNPQNAARVVRDSSKDNFDPEFITSESPTAEHGPTIVDQRGNALGGNSRAMVVKRVYDSKNGTAAKYRSALEEKAPQFGISADDLQRFKDPVLVRERVGPVDATTEVADYNRKAAADLTPDEQAVADGKRISDQTMGKIMGNLEAGDHESLADALRGDNGAELVNSLEKDGMVSPQEKAGLIQGDSLTAVAKDRIAKAMVGRMFESSADLKNIAPDMRNKLEKIAPQVARVESREGWTLTPKVREALSLVEEMRAAGSKNVDQYFKQDSLGGEPRGEYSPESQAIAKTLLKGPMQAAMAFRRYANEETNSRPGAAGNLFGALTQREAFEDAFVKRRGEAGSAPMLSDLANTIAKKLGRKAEDDIVTVKGDDGKLISLAVRKDFKGGFKGKTRDFRTPEELSNIAGDGWKEALATKGYKPENVVGSADFTPRQETDAFSGKESKSMQPGVAYVDPAFRRQGIASRMYDEAAKSFPDGHTLSDSPIGRKSDGQAFRAAYDRGAIASKITDALEAERKTDSPQSLKRIPEGSGITVSRLKEAVPEVTGADLQALENAGKINLMRGSVPTASPLSKGGIPLPGEKYPAVRVSLKASDAERGSAPMLMDLAQKIKDKLDGPDVGLEQNYSGVGAAETKFVRNLGQIKRAAPEAVPSLLKAASPNAQATIKMMMVMPKIEKALGSDLSTTDFKRVMIQDRLNAIRDSWEAWGRDTHSLDDKKLVASLGKGVNGLLWAMEDKQGLPGNLVETAAALAENKNIAGLRDFLHSTFADAASAVRDVMTPEEFVEHSNKAGFQRGLDVYKAELEPMLEASQARKEGAFSTAKGEFDTYYPLEPLAPKDKASLAEWNSRQSRLNPFSEVLNQKAGRSELGLQDTYDPASKVLKDRLSEAFRTKDKAAAIDALQSTGVMRELPAGSEPGRAYDFNGTPLKSTTMQIGFKRYEVPTAFARELKPILDPESGGVDPGAIQKLTNALNQVAVTGLAEPVYHSYNIMGTLISRVPFIGKGIAGKAGEIPFVRPFYQAVKLASTEGIRGDTISGENMQALQWLAEHGALGERYGTSTRSPRLAEITGGEVHRYTLGPSLYGPKGIDMRARIEMYKASQILDPKASVKDRVEFINQLGQYTKALQGEFERSVKSTGLSPFYTAGSTMLRNGLSLWTNTGPKLGQQGAAAQVAHMLTKGAVGTVGLWAMTYKAYTGQWPWQDSRSKLLQIPVNAEDRYSKVGQALWGSGPEQGYVNFGFFNPLVARGARALGVSGAYESHVLGGNREQMMDATEKDIVNSFMHPLLGPIPRAAFAGATGNEPYLTGLRDDRGKMAPQFWNVTRSGGVAARAGAAAKELNSFYGNLGAATGMLASERETKGNQWLRMVSDLAMPGAIGRPSDPYKKQQFVQKQQRGMERAEDKP